MLFALDILRFGYVELKLGGGKSAIIYVNLRPSETSKGRGRGEGGRGFERLR